MKETLTRGEWLGLSLLGLVALSLRLLQVDLHYNEVGPDGQVLVASALDLMRKGDFFKTFFGYGEFTKLFLFLADILYALTSFLFGSLRSVTTITSYDGFLMANRWVSCLFGAFTVIPFYLIGRKLYSKKLGLLAALLLCLSPVHFLFSRFSNPEAIALFVNSLVVLFSIHLIRSKPGTEWKYYLLAGFFAGIGVTCKINFLLWVLFPILCHFVRPDSKSFLEKVFNLKLLLMIAMTIGGFVLFSPLVILNLSTYLSWWYSLFSGVQSSFALFSNGQFDRFVTEAEYIFGFKFLIYFAPLGFLVFLRNKIGFLLSLFGLFQGVMLASRMVPPNSFMLDAHYLFPIFTPLIFFVAMGILFLFEKLLWLIGATLYFNSSVLKKREANYLKWGYPLLIFILSFSLAEKFIFNSKKYMDLSHHHKESFREYWKNKNEAKALRFTTWVQGEALTLYNGENSPLKSAQPYPFERLGYNKGKLPLHLFGDAKKEGEALLLDNDKSGFFFVLPAEDMFKDPILELDIYPKEKQILSKGRLVMDVQALYNGRVGVGLMLLSDRKVLLHSGANLWDWRRFSRKDIYTTEPNKWNRVQITLPKNFLVYPVKPIDVDILVVTIQLESPENDLTCQIKGVQRNHVHSGR